MSSSPHPSPRNVWIVKSIKWHYHTHTLTHTHLHHKLMCRMLCYNVPSISKTHPPSQDLPWLQRDPPSLRSHPLPGQPSCSLANTRVHKPSTFLATQDNAEEPPQCDCFLECGSQTNFSFSSVPPKGLIPTAFPNKNPNHRCVGGGEYLKLHKTDAQ